MHTPPATSPFAEPGDQFSPPVRDGADGEFVIIVDDDAALRDSLAALLEAAGFRVACRASSAALLAAGVPAETACLIVDVRLGTDDDGISLVEHLRRSGNRTPVVIVTGHGDIPLAVRAMRAGAADCLEKPFSHARLLQAMDIARNLGAEAARAATLIAELSAREREVLVGLVRGNPNKVIAADLGMSVRTAEAHRARIMEKLNVRSLPEVVRIALAAGIRG